MTSEHTGPSAPCVLCQAHDSTDDRATRTLWRRRSCFALLNAYPYTTGHRMVAPAVHIADIDELDASTLLEIMSSAQVLIRCLRKLYNPDGLNAGLNLGSAAGAGIEEHPHLHIVPRRTGDTDLMTVIGRIRVHPEDLDQSYDRIASALSRQLEGCA